MQAEKNDTSPLKEKQTEKQWISYQKQWFLKGRGIIMFKC